MCACVLTAGLAELVTSIPRPCRPQLWLGINNRGPMTASGIYQVIARRGCECGIGVFLHRFRHNFSHTWLDRRGAEGDLMELNGWISPQMLRRYGAGARSARARRSYDRVIDDEPLPEPPRGCRSSHPAKANYPSIGSAGNWSPAVFCVGVRERSIATSGYYPGSRRHVDRGHGAALAPYRPSVVRGSRPIKGGEAFPVASTGSWGVLRPERGSWPGHVAVLRFDHGPCPLECRQGGKGLALSSFPVALARSQACAASSAGYMSSRVAPLYSSPHGIVYLNDKLELSPHACAASSAALRS
jgi:hypothetical protein